MQPPTGLLRRAPHLVVATRGADGPAQRHPALPPASPARSRGWLGPVDGPRHRPSRLHRPARQGTGHPAARCSHPAGVIRRGPRCLGPTLVDPLSEAAPAIRPCDPPPDRRGVGPDWDPPRLVASRGTPGGGRQVGLWRLYDVCLPDQRRVSGTSPWSSVGRVQPVGPVARMRTIAVPAVHAVGHRADAILLAASRGTWRRHDLPHARRRRRRRGSGERRISRVESHRCTRGSHDRLRRWSQAPQGVMASRFPRLTYGRVSRPRG